MNEIFQKSMGGAAVAESDCGMIGGRERGRSAAGFRPAATAPRLRDKGELSRGSDFRAPPASRVPFGERSAKAMFCFSLAGFIYNVEPAQIFQKTRCVRRVSEARQVGMYLAHTVFGVTHPEIAALLRRDRTTVRHGIRCVEDRRDNPDFDDLIGSLERLSKTISGPNAAALIWNGTPGTDPDGHGRKG